MSRRQEGVLRRRRKEHVATGGDPGAATIDARWPAGRKKEVVLRLLRGEPVERLLDETNWCIRELVMEIEILHKEGQAEQPITGTSFAQLDALNFGFQAVPTPQHALPRFITKETP